MRIINNTTFPAFFRWRPKAWFRVTGADAFSFLQGQFTNDLKRVREEAVYGLWLTLKGKVMGDGFVLGGTTDEEFWIGSYSTPATALQQRLDSFIIADDVLLEDQTAEWCAVSVFGDIAAERVGQMKGTAGDGFIFPGRRSRPANLEWVFRQAAAAETSQALHGMAEWDLAAVESQRIAAGVPAVPADIGPGDLPNEGGLDDEAISFTKGCYLGQEVMARLKSMGQVRRRLLRVRGSIGRVPAYGTPLYIGGKQVGEIRSAVAEGSAAFVGFAMISLIALGGKSTVALTPEGTPDVSIFDMP